MKLGATPQVETLDESPGLPARGGWARSPHLWLSLAYLLLVTGLIGGPAYLQYVAPGRHIVMQIDGVGYTLRELAPTFRRQVQLLGEPSLQAAIQAMEELQERTLVLREARRRKLEASAEAMGALPLGKAEAQSTPAGANAPLPVEEDKAQAEYLVLRGALERALAAEAAGAGASADLPSGRPSALKAWLEEQGASGRNEGRIRWDFRSQDLEWLRGQSVSLSPKK